MKPKKINKPWGYELHWALTSKYLGKILVVFKGKRLSYQYHRYKEETIYVLKGAIRFEYSTQQAGKRKQIIIRRGEGFHIPPKLKHRMEALELSHILEVSTPFLHDVIRLEDDFGRS